MSSQDSRASGVASLRDRRVARVIDREIAPIWHDRFARLIIRNLPSASDVIALDIHCGVGRTTAELLSRLGSAARVLAIEPDDTLIEFARTRMRPEWKNRVYLKPGNFDDVAAMADDSYNLVVANLVLGDASDIGSALAEMIRVNRIGGRILATLPMSGSWHEVEDIFAEVLRDAGLTAAVRRLERLRELRPTGAELAQVVRNCGVAEDDFVVEQERFQMLFPSGREFLFAPVVEHGPLRLWKAVIGKDGSPQELFWRLKEAIDTYYSGHVLAVNVTAGLMNINVAKGTDSPGPRLAARYWRHYPGLDALWGGLAAGYVRMSEPSLPFGKDDSGDFDFDLEIDEGEGRRTGAQGPVTTSANILNEDFYDPEPSTESPATSSPARPVGRFSAAARIGSEPARAMSTLQSARASQSAARLKRPPIAEDDFSDLDDRDDRSDRSDRFISTPSPRLGDLRDAHAGEPVDGPTASSSSLRLHAARRALGLEPAPVPLGPADAPLVPHAIDELTEFDDPTGSTASPSRALIDDDSDGVDDDEVDEFDEVEEATRAAPKRPPTLAPRAPSEPRRSAPSFTRPSAESSGFTRPSAESSGLLRRPTSLRDPVMATGSFNVFAPPRPRAPGEPESRDPADVHDSEISSIAALEALVELRDTRPLASQTPVPEPVRPAPAPGSSDESALLDELDELDALDSFDEAEPLELLEEEPAPAPRAAPPPPPRAPPPPPGNTFKPRPLLPIVPPKKK